MKKIFLLSLLVISLALNSQTNDTATTDPFQRSIDARTRRMQDSADKMIRDIYWENNTRNLDELMRTVEKRRKKDKTRAVLYIVIGVGLMLVLVAKFMRKNAEKKINQNKE